MKILFLPQTSDLSPAARFRVYQYLPYLEREGIVTTVLPAIKAHQHAAMYDSPGTFRKLRYYSQAVLERLGKISLISDYDCLMIQKETFPQMYPLFEQLAAKKTKKVIFDFDDSIFLKYKYFFNKSFFKGFLKECAHIIAGNDFLAEYAAHYNENVSVIPTVIDTDIYKYEKKEWQEDLNLGWSGTLTTHQYLNLLNKPLTLLFKKYKNLKLVIISNSKENIQLDIPRERIEFVRWNSARVVEDLKKVDIGLMPLSDDDWARGKCGLKALQYMSLGIPAICSPVGVNSKIIDDGVNGFLAKDDSEWGTKLEKIVENKELFENFSVKAQETVVEKYSVKKWLPELISVFKKVAEQ